MIAYSYLPDRLVFTADAESREELAAADYDKQLSLVLDDVTGNGLEIVAPEEIGALTSSEIFCHDLQRDDDGTVTDAGGVYWFPNYQITNPWQVLADTGRVEFSRGNA